MRTNIVLDDKLVAQGLRLTGLKTRRALMDLALKELIRRRRQRNLLRLRGAVRWEGSLDQLRRGRAAQ
jgi:Arc/MetJ family transcription regulator